MPDAPVMQAVLQAEGISHRYGGVLALDNVSLALPQGAAIAMVGPDGVGKSTLLGLIAGVKALQQGQLQVLGHDLARHGGRETFLGRVAYMPQGLGRNLYPTLTVAENIDFFGRLFGLDSAARAAHMARLLEATGLAPFPDRPAGKLSGGMKQKLGLCCALVHDPDLLVLDEPTTGVDPLSRRQFWDLVDSLRAERPHLTVLVSTAYMEEAERFGHLVAMDDGRIIAQGATEAILAQVGAATLEEAYIRLLPEARRPDGAALVVPPFHDAGGAPAIEAHGLVRRFGDFIAVDHVNFRIARGEIFGFLGSNGCGKTTTMKMLTGLLDVSEGQALLLGTAIRPGDMATRQRVGYMSQAFSLYEELTVRQNLALHARLYHVAGGAGSAGPVARALEEFALAEHADALPSALPLGIRQRLQLAAACLHRPEILILDEPTSGVDPAARAMFWRHLVRLSREDGVTIFVSTHFMNEAERCDRISLMHRGRVLAVGSPAELMRDHGTSRLEDAFIAVLEQDAAGDAGKGAPAGGLPVSGPVPAPAPAVAERDGQAEARSAVGAWLAYAWAFARREALELLRDRVRLAFALLGPLALLCIAANAISFDVQDVRLAVLDQDRTSGSRDLVLAFQGSRYFRAMGSLDDDADAERALRDGRVQMVLNIPPGFGRDLAAGRQPQVGLEIDGSSPFPAANAQAYAQAILSNYTARLMAAGGAGAGLALPLGMEPRFIYNQEFRSIYAITPGVLMLTLILIPAMLTALGIVREKEIGSITNLYASPASTGAFLLGKQAPYVALAMVSFVMLVVVIVTVLGVPLQGSLAALSLGALLFVLAATGLGLMISTFVRSQVSAIFATSLICLVPSVNFSGLLYPVSTLAGASYWVGVGFPSGWFQIVSLGTFTKGLGLASFTQPYLALGGFALAYVAAARLMLRKQEA